jgi:hypothetical protein
MNYYETFKQTADNRAKSLHKTITDLRGQLPHVEKRLADETHNRDNFTGRLAKLQDLSIECLAGGQGEYDRYKTSMKKLQNDLQVSTEIIENITKNILPNARGRLHDAERNLKIVLYQLAHESRKAADTDVLEPALRNLLAEIDAQQEAVARGFEDYGQVYVADDESLIPGIWPCQEINDLKVRLGMTANPEPTREEVFRNYMSASPPESKSVAETPDSTEPEQIGPDEPPTPQEPIDDPFGEPVRTE